MLENHIKSIVDKTINNIELSGKRTKLNDIISNNELDASYRLYFLAQLNWWIYEEKLNREANKNFDFEDFNKNELSDKLDEYYRDNAWISSDNIKKLLDEAVKVRANYLTRPIQTLVIFAFRNEPTKPFVEIKRRIEYFYDYNYLTQGLSEKFDELEFSDKQIISKNEFEQILQDIDFNYLTDKSIEDFAELLITLFNFFSVENHTGIDTKIMEVFLLDKGLVEINDKFKQIIGQKKIDFLSLNDFISIYKEIFEDIITDDSSRKLEDISEETLPDNSVEITPDISEETAPDVSEETSSEIQQPEIKEESTSEPEIIEELRGLLMKIIE